MKKISELTIAALMAYTFAVSTPVSTSNIPESGKPLRQSLTKIVETSSPRQITPAPRTYSCEEISGIIHETYKSIPNKPKYVTEDFLKGIVNVESEYNVRAKSKKGASGLMQIMPGAWSDVEKTRKYEDYVFDPKTNIEVGIKYLSHLDRLSRKNYPGWKSLPPEEKRKIVLGSFNWGPGKMARSGFNLEEMPKGTKNYVKDVSRKMNY